MVKRGRVLRRPSISNLLDVPVPAGEVLEAFVARGERAPSARVVAFAAHDQQVAIRAYGSGGSRGADRHALWQGPAHACSDAVRTLRLQPGEEETAIKQRVVGRDNHLIRGDRALRGTDSARRAFRDGKHARSLENHRSIAVERIGKALDIADRVELKLVCQTHRASDL